MNTLNLLAFSLSVVLLLIVAIVIIVLCVFVVAQVNIAREMTDLNESFNRVSDVKEKT